MEKHFGILFLYKNQPILQRRGLWNWEDHKPHSMQNAYQFTVHGKAKPKEDWINGIMREIKEELGNNIFEKIDPQKILFLTEHKVKGKIFRNYVYLKNLSKGAIKEICLEPSSGGLVPFPFEEIHKLKIIKDHSKKGSFENMISRDEVDALIKLQEKLKK